MAYQNETVLVEVDAGVATVTLNRPEKRNAINTQMDRELHDALFALDADEGVRAIVVTGRQPDAAEGVMATLERRKPVWKGSKHVKPPNR